MHGYRCIRDPHTCSLAALQECMNDMLEKHPSVKQARSVGLFGGLDIQKNSGGEFVAKVTDPLAPSMAAFRKVPHAHHHHRCLLLPRAVTANTASCFAERCVAATDSRNVFFRKVCGGNRFTKRSLASVRLGMTRRVILNHAFGVLILALDNDCRPFLRTACGRGCGATPSSQTHRL